MTGGGIQALVAYGAQNVILSGNPQMTYFYKAFKRYTHYASENITVAVEGPNELFFDQPIRLRAKIPRFGDLLSDMYFSFRLPDIYSKYITPAEGVRTTQWEFEWVKYIGARVIQSAAFFVGGQKIQEFDGSYILSKALIDFDQDKFAKWSTLVGNTPQLTEPAASRYSGGLTNTGYPSVVQNPSVGDGPQTNRPSILGQDIHIPLSFWFTEDTACALPLIGLQYHDCEVQLVLNPISELYTILDPSGARLNPEYAIRSSQADIQANNPFYVATNDISGHIRYFVTDFGVAPPILDGWFINPRLQCNFIYLAKDEQQVFSSRPLAYLYRQVTQYPFPGLFKREVLDLQTHNPITRLIFVQRRSDALQRNDFANFTNWALYPKAPFIPTPGIDPGLQNAGSSGLLVPSGQLDMIRAIRVLCDGNEIQEQKPIDFFTHLTTYKYTTGIGQDGLPIYSFELKSPSTQPTGSINASRIRNFQVELDVYPLPAGTNYTYDVDIYVENLNWFEVASGMGGVKYAL